MIRNTLLYAILIVSLTVSCSKKDNETTQNNPDDIPPATNLNIEENGKIVLGAPTDKSIQINLLFNTATVCRVDYSTDKNQLTNSTAEKSFQMNVPNVITLDNLLPQKRYYFRLSYKENGATTYSQSNIYTFVTKRLSGSAFSFGVQGDSHPERAGNMFNAQLYLQNMENVSQKGVDFYFAMGDDFSIENLIQNNTVTQPNVDAVYQLQRKYLGAVGCNASIFLVNGNHEQAAKYLLDGTATNPAVMAANARKKYYPAPLPDNFYSGDNENVPFIGKLGDYYAFTWGDALFVVIDPYWHSSIAVDNDPYGTTQTNKNYWDITLGLEQYNWFKNVLQTSTAKYKFVFTHHVLGTGRGGIEEANLCEWGGYSKNGTWGFTQYRSGWEMPIHQLMVANHVTIFFQGHDHLYCKQILDGVIYQSVPNPADNTYTAFNASAYTSGIIYPNSGFLNVSVSSDKVQVDYIAAALSGASITNNSLVYSYTVN